MTTFPQYVLKRDGATRQAFDLDKMRSAITRAWLSQVPTADDLAIAKVIKTALEALSFSESYTTVEDIQDVIEFSLMKHQHFAVAKHYMLYRQQRAEARQLREHQHPDPKAVSDFIHASKYGKWDEKLQRREVHHETVARVEGMHLRKFPHMADEIREAFDLVRQERVLPSMRSMQFGGLAIEVNNNRIYNCCFSHIDRIEAFNEAFFLLLSGCGVGYSVQFDHVEQLPTIGYVDPKKVRHHVVADTIEGWADSAKALFQSFLDGVYLEFSYHLIRPAGAWLKTSGGRAPGHMKLKEALERVRGILSGAQGRKLRPKECHTIMCHLADAVLSGGIRRSAMIALFSLDDSEMMQCKTGDWFSREPWLQNANNSVMLKRDEVTRKQFNRIFQMTRQWGEPGFYFTWSYEYGCNPCCEIGLNPILRLTPEVIEQLIARGYKGNLQATYGGFKSELTGWAFCNLCELNAAKFKTFEDFKAAAKAATLIGTLQATYTNMPYLGPVSELIAERDALLGIGMTGMMDSPDIACNPAYQREVAEDVKAWNEGYAARFGIRPAARTTCVKPSGTTSLKLGCVASGHHGHHGRRYIRRVTCDEYETVFQAFRVVNPHMCVRKPDGKWVIEFPVEAPAGAILKNDMNAIEFLEKVKSTQQNWVVPGTAKHSWSEAPGLLHNVSNTAHVSDEEWDKVAAYLWENKDSFTGVSLISNTSDKAFAFAPNEEITTQADEARWNQLLAHYKPVDYLTLFEEQDNTDLTGEAACAGGMCLIT